MPRKTDDKTHQTLHASVLQQKNLRKDVEDNIKANPGLIQPLQELEREIKDTWTFDPSLLAKVEDRTDLSESEKNVGSYIVSEKAGSRFKIDVKSMLSKVHL